MEKEIIIASGNKGKIKDFVAKTNKNDKIIIHLS